MKRIKHALIYIITGLLIVMNISFAPVVRAEGDTPTATSDNAVIAMILAYLAASGMTFNWQSANQAFTSVGDWFSQYAISIGNTVTLSAIAADAAVVNGAVKVAGKSAQVMQDFQAWLTNKFSIPETGSVEVVQGNNIYSDHISGTYKDSGGSHSISDTLSNYGQAIFVMYHYATSGGGSYSVMVITKTKATVSYGTGSWTLSDYFYSPRVGYYGNILTGGYYTNGEWSLNDIVLSPVVDLGLLDGSKTASQIYDLVAAKYGKVWDVASSAGVDANTLSLDNSKVWTSDNALLLDMAGAIAKTGENVAALTDTVGVIAGSIANSASLATTDVTARTVAADYAVPSDQTASSYGVLGLDDVFPFCIPFDVYYIIKALDHAPEAPVIPFVIKADGIVDYRQDLDLSSWNTVAEVFRNCEVIAFIFSLVLVTRRLIRG